MRHQNDCRATMPMARKTAASAESAAKPASARSRARASDATAPRARFRLRIMAGEVIAIGPGKVELLEAISATGSITAAARQLGMSYRRAWMLLDELNRALREPAIDSAKGGTHGGGSELTPTGRMLLRQNFQPLNFQRTRTSGFG